ncbi:collagen-binding protein [Marivirga lumbricoides]|uniref:Collagen-binding protein n=1 Tax=Marivirga lumbricoides TaxID=1046115 RepID=A0ABQ1LKH5_9BACT|nr:collagen-binding protein [Marivirga lumbricoides]
MKLFRQLVLIFSFILSFNTISAQVNEHLLVTINRSNISAPSFIKEIEQLYDVRFRYKSEWLEDIFITVNVFQEPLNKVLNDAFNRYQLSFIFKEPNYIIFLKNSPVLVNVDSKDKGRDLQIISLGEPNFRDSTARVSGLVKSGEDGSVIPGVKVSAIEAKLATVTNEKGEYDINLPIGYHTLRYESVNVEAFEVSIILNSSSKLNMSLYSDLVQLNEVVVTAKALDENVSETITGSDRITIDEIEKMPAFLGEADIIKSITSLPGVNLTGEASAGFNVRGSGVGANLVLLDDGTIFNSSHLFGFFTAFNPDGVEDVQLYKGTIPARFGGRIASVLDISMKNGNKDEFEASGGIGVISSRLNITTPIIREKSSVVFGVRAAYPNYIIKSVKNKDLKQSSSSFGDVNFKYHHLINDKNQFELTAYGSNDQFSIRNEVEYNYINESLTTKWRHNYNPQFSSDFSYNYSRYRYSLVETLSEDLETLLNSKIENSKINWFFNIDNNEAHRIKFGVNGVFYQLNPGELSANYELRSESSNIASESAIESALYVSDEWKINNNISMYGGLRYTYFMRGKLGSGNYSYGGLEPRFSFNYKVNNKSSIKFGYNRMQQFIHLISNTASVTPVDIWKLSDFNIKPTISDQYTLGYFRNFFANNIEGSVEVFYKNIYDLIDYKNGAQLLGNHKIEDELLQGEGEAYGMEMYIKKLRGKLTGWVSYTYSRSLITVNSENLLERINEGNAFPTNFDQPHNLSLFGNLKVSRRFDISANFLYNTGRPITYPESVYDVFGVKVANYTNRNGDRIPDYHRLDLSFHLGTTLKRNKTVKANWVLTFYNVYSRRNAYSVFFRSSDSLREIDAFKLSIVGQIIPALSYDFKF